MKTKNKSMGRYDINAWLRAYYTMYPIVNSTINAHSLAISKAVEIDYSELPEKITNFYRTILETKSIPEIISGISSEYLILGEVFPYIELNEKTGRLNIKIQNPDYVVVKPLLSGGNEYSLRPDEKLRKEILKEPDNLKLKYDLSVINCVRNGENIPMNNLYIHHFKNQMMPYEIRGNSYFWPMSNTLTLFTTTEDILIKKESESKLNDFFLCKEYYHKKSMEKFIEQFMNQLKTFLETKVFLLFSKINGLAQIKNGMPDHCVPQVSFDMKIIQYHLEQLSQ